MDPFLVVTDPITRRCYRGSVSGPRRLENSAVYLRGDQQPEEPLTIHHEMGSRSICDVNWTTDATLRIISERVHDLLIREEVSGWGTFPVEVQEDPEHNWKGLAVLGRCGPLDRQAGEVVIEDFPAMSVPRLKGLHFDPETWDGSDLFMPRDHTLWVFATQKVAAAFAKEKITNVQFRRADEILRD
jgi:hypothetical protein